MAKNKVQIKIYGATYSILTDDDAEYVEGLGEFIDEEMKNIASANPSLSSIQCAVLVALDQADACKKSTAAADNLRAQIKDYLEDSARARMEVDVARREIERLNREISNLREKLNSWLGFFVAPFRQKISLAKAKVFLWNLKFWLLQARRRHLLPA